MLNNYKIAVSTLDHIYHNISITDELKTQTLNNSSLDHIPVLVKYHRDWKKVVKAINLNKMVAEFNSLIIKALDNVTPVKTFTVKSNYKFFLSKEIEILMRKREHG
jgi:hypothetical protein